MATFRRCVSKTATTMETARSTVVFVTLVGRVSIVTSPFVPTTAQALENVFSLADANATSWHTVRIAATSAVLEIAVSEVHLEENATATELALVMKDFTVMIAHNAGARTTAQDRTAIVCPPQANVVVVVNSLEMIVLSV